MAESMASLILTSSYAARIRSRRKSRSWSGRLERSIFRECSAFFGLLFGTGSTALEP
jgi:hypothetical protein